MAITTPPGDLGMRAPEFALPGVDGRQRCLDDVRGRSGLVVAFICNHCPYVQAIRARLVRAAIDLQSIGVGFVAINSNDASAYPEDSFEQMRAQAVRHDFTFPYLYDESQRVARAYGAVCTPDFFGFDSALYLRYRGRLDASRKESVPEAQRELFEAMSSVAGGGAAPAEQHASIGCSIKWKSYSA